MLRFELNVLSTKMCLIITKKKIKLQTKRCWRRKSEDKTDEKYPIDWKLTQHHENITLCNGKNIQQVTQSVQS